MTILLIILSAVLFILVVIQRTTSMQTNSQLDKMLQMVDDMKNGRLDGRLRLGRSDRIGRLGNALDELADTLQNELVASLVRFADGDFTRDISANDNQDEVRNALHKASNELNSVLTRLLIATRDMGAGAMQVADSSQSLSQGATEQASSLEEVTSTMIEMASQTTVNAENANKANLLALGARDSAAKGSVQMAEMIMAMEEMNDAAKSISKIIKVIDEIAFQTNLLALNAAVEAARAGKHGKGFAVVAEEVRGLAARSAKAARETAALIESSVEKTVSGTEIGNKTAEGLGEIVRVVSEVTELVEEIARASNEQAQGISQVNEGLNQIELVTQQNTANAEESASAAEELSSQVDQAEQMLKHFTLKGFSAATHGHDEHFFRDTVDDYEEQSDSSDRDIRALPDNTDQLSDSEYGKY
jgi:methyl-accepting chemotaxis protein